MGMRCHIELVDLKLWQAAITFVKSAANLH
jgi:hypothetical protein